MSEGAVHKQLKAVGMKWIKEKVTDVVCREVKYKNMRSIADVVGINLKRREVRILEAKASKADYVRDKKLLELDYSYYKHCHYFYIICPDNIIQPDDVPKEYGLLWVNIVTNEVTIKRTPKKYTGRLKTMFDTSLKNSIKANTNDLLFHYVYPEYNITVINKFKKGKIIKQRKTINKKS